MITHWKTCLNLALDSLRLRRDRAVDGIRLAMCRATVHPFEPDGTRCPRCDAARTMYWGHWVVIDG